MDKRWAGVGGVAAGVSSRKMSAADWSNGAAGGTSSIISAIGRRFWERGYRTTQTRVTALSSTG